MTGGRGSRLADWYWDRRVIPHVALCPEHARAVRLTRAERMRGDPRDVSFEDVGLLTLAEAMHDVRSRFRQPAEIGCSNGQCTLRLASVGTVWDELDGGSTAAPLPPLAMNASVVQFVRAGATPASSEWSRADERLAGWELRCHPDLVERLQAAAAPLQASLLFAYGLPVLVHPNGVAFAAASGTSLIVLRLPPEARGGLQRSRWRPDDVLGSGWVDVEPWLDLPEPGPTQRLSEWLSRAFEHVASLHTD